jgi:hypothetical protein
LAKSQDNLSVYSEMSTCIKKMQSILKRVRPVQEDFEDSKGAIRIRKSRKEGQITQWPKEKGQKDKNYKTYT